MRSSAVRAWSARRAESSSSAAEAPSRAPSAVRTFATRAVPLKQGYNHGCRPGDRGRVALEESPDTAGQDAGEIPGGESRRKVAQKGDRLRRMTLRRRRR
jgi:hypothetical protein